MPTRFDASLIAFHSLSRKMGEPWTAALFRRAMERAEADPEVRRALATQCGARALNTAIGPHGEGRENRGLLSWNAQQVPPPLLALPKFTGSAKENTAWLKGLAERLGAAAVGIAPLRRELVYAQVQRNAYDPGPPERKAIEFRDVAAPGETDDALVIPDAVARAVVVLVRSSRRELRSKAFGAPSAETNLGYSRMGTVALSLAEAIRALGYVGIPCMNDTALSIPLAVEAGLGTVGRHGLLIANGIGPAVRIAKVLTDLPLAEDRPSSALPLERCLTCSACATVCPAGAISSGDPTAEAVHPCNSGGSLKWPVDGEACLRHWVSQGESCALCQGTCPAS